MCGRERAPPTAPDSRPLRRAAEPEAEAEEEEEEEEEKRAEVEAEVAVGEESEPMLKPAEVEALCLDH